MREALKNDIRRRFAEVVMTGACQIVTAENHLLEVVNEEELESVDEGGLARVIVGGKMHCSCEVEISAAKSATVEEHEPLNSESLAHCSPSVKSSSESLSC